MSRKNWKARAVSAGYQLDTIERLIQERDERARTRHNWSKDPLCMVNHPERGRAPQRVSERITKLVYTHTWVPDDAHPLGGYDGTVTLYRRVNLRKDDLPGWYVRASVRPLYEFTKESA